MRPPDHEYLHDWRGMVVTVREWCNWTDIPYDDIHCDDEPQPENAEGYDLLCEVALAFNGQTFTAGDSLGAVWIIPNPEGLAYLREEQANVRDAALSLLLDDLTRSAGDALIIEAQKRRNAAHDILAALTPEESER
jgi:hypothetical protein